MRGAVVAHHVCLDTLLEQHTATAAAAAAAAAAEQAAGQAADQAGMCRHYGMACGGLQSRAEMVLEKCRPSYDYVLELQV